MNRLPGSGIKVIFVDDSPDLRRSIGIILGQFFGFDVRCVESVDDARHEMEMELPDVVLLDLMMPDESGVVLLREIREKDLPIRVVIATAMSPSGDAIKEVWSLKPYRVLHKEIAMPSLLAALLPPESEDDQ